MGIEVGKTVVGDKILEVPGGSNSRHDDQTARFLRGIEVHAPGTIMLPALVVVHKP